MVDQCYVCDAAPCVCPNKGKGKGKGLAKGKGKGKDKSIPYDGKNVWRHFYKCKCGWTVAPAEGTPRNLAERCQRPRNSWSAKLGQKGCGMLRGAGMEGWCDAGGTVMPKAALQDLEEKFNVAQGKAASKPKKKKKSRKAKDGEGFDDDWAPDGPDDFEELMKDIEGEPEEEALARKEKAIDDQAKLR